MDVRLASVPRFLVFAMTATLSSSCANVNELGAQYGTAIGCGAGLILGGLAGAAIGQRTGNTNQGAAIGALGGLSLGCVVGNRWQKREKALQQLAKRENLSIHIETLSVGPAGGQSARPTSTGSPATSTPTPTAATKDAGLVANIQDSAMFDSDSDQFTIAGLRQAKALADIYKPEAPGGAGKPKESTALLVVGHTDATGSAEHNQELSERRANSMGRILAEAGIDPSRVYFQGAGSGRPIADNTTDEGRARNRRVEITEVETADLLIQRIQEEEASPKYLANGTATSRATASGFPRGNQQSGAALPEPRSSAIQNSPDFVDFGGHPTATDSNNLSAYVKPARAGFSLITSAFAESTRVQDCHLDSPRVIGAVKNLATGQTPISHETRDYFPGMNGRAWAGLVNGHLVTVTPVSVLKDSAKVAINPTTFITRDYSSGQRRASDGIGSVANTYDGEHAILYRVFLEHEHAPLECFDVVMPKDGSGTSPAGKLYYDRGGTSYVAPFVPQGS